MIFCGKPLLIKEVSRTFPQNLLKQTKNIVLCDFFVSFVQHYIFILYKVFWKGSGEPFFAKRVPR